LQSGTEQKYILAPVFFIGRGGAIRLLAPSEIEALWLTISLFYTVSGKKEATVLSA